MDVVMIFLPLVASAIAGLFWRYITDRGAQLVTCGALLVSMVLAWIVFFDVGLHHGAPRTTEIFTWFLSGGFEAHWTVTIDQLTAVMLIVVTTVSAMVHIYSIGYMHGDPSIPRFMSYLSLFTFCMLMLVTANNFMQLFFGWEGVGLCSYLLVGFWYLKPSANAAAIKAFVVNRVGDFGFMLGIMGVYFVFKNVGFAEVFKAAPAMAGTTIDFLGMRLPTLETLCLLLFVGAMGKSAQIGLHTWLPDAMEGPTPVSALIHAATMVTAGVFMVCRLSPIFEYAPFALSFVTVIGAVTCFFTATIGILFLLIVQFIAAFTQGMIIIPRSIVGIFLCILQLIGFSYRAAADPSNGFLLSFIGYTAGVGLCEELCKAAPLFFKYREPNDQSWKGAFLWGIASGAGFGLAEGVTYASDFYNGVSGADAYFVRNLSCVALHAVWTGSAAITLHRKQHLFQGEMAWYDFLVRTLVVIYVPMILHGLYDTLLKKEMSGLALVVAVASFGYLAFQISRLRGGDDRVATEEMLREYQRRRKVMQG